MMMESVTADMNTLTMESQTSELSSPYRVLDPVDEYINEVWEVCSDKSSQSGDDPLKPYECQLNTKLSLMKDYPFTSSLSSEMSFLQNELVLLKIHAATCET